MWLCPASLLISISCLIPRASYCSPSGSKDATALKRLCDDWVGVGYGGDNEGDGGVNLDKAFSKYCGDRDELTADLFGELLEHLGVEANDERMREAFYGTERPDVISFAEFMSWWLR